MIDINEWMMRMMRMMMVHIVTAFIILLYFTY